MRKEDLVFFLGRLGYPLVTPETEELKEEQVLELLSALVDSKEPRLVEGFPVVLANCAQRGMNLDFVNLLSEYKPNSGKRQDLEKLLLISSELLTQEGLDRPKNLDKVLTSLKAKYGDLVANNDVVPLSNRVSLSIERLRNTLRRYMTNKRTARSARRREKDKQRSSFQMNYYLGTLFPPKQKELVLKKLRKEPLNKTEREYFSRTVKKKLEALSNPEVKKVVAALTRK